MTMRDRGHLGLRQSAFVAALRASHRADSAAPASHQPGGGTGWALCRCRPPLRWRDTQAFNRRDHPRAYPSRRCRPRRTGQVKRCVIPIRPHRAGSGPLHTPRWARPPSSGTVTPRKHGTRAGRLQCNADEPGSRTEHPGLRGAASRSSSQRQRSERRLRASFIVPA